ncbi:hypothetical protein C2G38_2160708 [Gigaspora rosea]|uniref:Uncharacterized protein n=1 Tax=Gigaspora rosea TaxID=44941 RepID=A0A397VZY8_9GLOM|nr:hypothetical protein C2G38_2160708 [Gigaspora rosea]
MLALLKSQIEKADLEGTYLISRDNAVYIIDQHTQIIDLESSKRESEGRRLHHKMQEYIKEISRSRVTTQQLKIPNRRTWEKKVLSTCSHISFDLVNHKTQLLYYYDLGALMEARAWDKSAKELIKHPNLKEFKIF